MPIEITDNQKAKAARREAGMRRRVYPRWVAQGRMTQEKADFEIAVMEVIASDYERRAATQDLFGGGANAD